MMAYKTKSDVWLKITQKMEKLSIYYMCFIRSLKAPLGCLHSSKNTLKTTNNSLPASKNMIILCDKFLQTFINKFENSILADKK
jgi:hypothetical protein